MSSVFPSPLSPYRFPSPVHPTLRALWKLVDNPDDFPLMCQRNPNVILRIHPRKTCNGFVRLGRVNVHAIWTMRSWNLLSLVLSFRPSMTNHCSRIQFRSIPSDILHRSPWESAKGGTSIDRALRRQTSRYRSPAPRKLEQDKPNGLACAKKSDKMGG